MADSGERLDSLNEAWNRLRNDVVGRGLQPVSGVPAEFARTVQAAWEDWRAFYEDKREDLVGAIWGYGDELDIWQSLYEELHAQAQAFGVVRSAPRPRTLPQPEASLVEPTVTVETPEIQVKPAINWGLVGLGVLGLGATALWLRSR